MVEIQPPRWQCSVLGVKTCPALPMAMLSPQAFPDGNAHFRLKMSYNPQFPAHPMAMLSPPGLYSAPAGCRVPFPATGAMSASRWHCSVSSRLPSDGNAYSGRRAENSARLSAKFQNEAYDTAYSQAVTHPSTNAAQSCLTSVIGRELVFSTWYGRRHEQRLLVRV